MAVVGAIGVGVAGVGPGWPDQRAALLALRGRVRVAAVHDAVPLRADAAAAEVGAAPADGLLALARRSDVRAVLLGDPAWWGLAALDLLLTAGRPVLLAGPTDPGDDRLDALAARAASAGTVVVPDLARRFTPATLRLRELAATVLGPVHAVRVVAPRPAAPPLQESYRQPADADRFAKLADWCAHLLPGRVGEVDAAADPAAGPATCELRCEPGSPVTGEAGDGPGALLTIADWGDDGDAPVKAVVRCERGAATLTGGGDLRFTVRGEPERVEDLSGERPGFETLLTLFLRRAVGGLIPAPDLHDLNAALTLTRAATLSAAGGEPVPISQPGENRLRPR